MSSSDNSIMFTPTLGVNDVNDRQALSRTVHCESTERPQHRRAEQVPRFGRPVSGGAIPSTADLLPSAMLHLRPSTLRPQDPPVWPAVTVTTPATAFSERPALRKLIVVMEEEIAAAATEQFGDDLGLLVGLLSHPYITRLRYADDGPPDDAPRVPSRTAEAVEGWVQVGPAYEDDRTYPVVSCDGTTITERAITGDYVPTAERDDTSGAYADLSSKEAAERRRADAIAVQAAAVSGADLFITRRPYLHQVTWELAPGVLVARPEDALAVAALYLRSQGVFETFRSIDGHVTAQVNRGLFYANGARAMLPAWWRWYNASRQHAGEDTRLAYLAQSVVTRLQRALEARDLVHRALNQPQNNDTADLALASLDKVLLMLMGALDVTARLAHRSLGLTISERLAGWQSSRWLGHVAASDQGLAESFALATWNGTVVCLLSRLRNSVHAAAPSPLGLRTGLGRDATLVGFPHIDGDELADWMDRLGGRGRWGMRTILAGRYHFDPDALLEHLFPAAVQVIDNAMAATPVERLAGVQLSDELRHPPPLRWEQASILRQLSLGPPPPDSAAGT